MCGCLNYNTKVWTDQYGRTERFSDMGTQHLQNIRKYLCNNNNIVPDKLNKELRSRGC